MSSLHTFANQHVDKNLTDVTGEHENELFFNCVFKKLNGLVLKDCDLNHSEFVTDSVADALGFTLTLGCKSFRGVRFSPLLFDLFLMLAHMSKGNDKKREQLLDVVGRPRAAALLRILEVTE